MVLLSTEKKEQHVEACYSFKAEIWSYDGTIQKCGTKFQPYILTNQVSQSCNIFLESDVKF